jgi:hypothetical protein
MDYVKLLLARGADPNVRAGQDHGSVYEVARPRGDLPLLALLRDAGAVTESKASVGPRPPDDPFRLGATVTHPKFGLGQVTATEGAGVEGKLTVRFGAVSRTLLAKFLTSSDVSSEQA